jgi:hypothetical protein
MPNTLAHLGVQGLASRSLLRGSDLKWVYIGCIIPDIPWIMQRILKLSFFNINLYDLRLYVIVQASLCFCLLLCLALATLCKSYWKVFIVLSINSFFHLLLDTFQIKWATGVHFFAPFNWEMTNFGLFWPESFPTYIITAFGLIFFVVNWRKSTELQSKLVFRPFMRIYLFILLVTIYFVLPFFLVKGPERADNHYVKTLRYYHSRLGSYVEFDRNRYTPKNSNGILTSFAGEKIRVEGIKLQNPAVVSVRGHFIDNDLVRVSEFHVHSDLFRNTASYVGLSLVVILWIISFLPQRRGAQGGMIH